MDENASLGDQVKDQTQHAVQQGQQIAGQTVSKVTDQVKGQLSTQKDNLAGAVDSVALVLMQASNTLKEQGQPAIAGYGDKAAEEITKVGDYLKKKQVDELVSDLGDYGRSNPVVFLSAAVLLGAVAARFLKSSGKAVTQTPTFAPPPVPAAPAPAPSIPASSSGGGYYSNAPASPTTHDIPAATGMGDGPALHGVDVGDEDEFAPTSSGIDYIEAADATGARMSNDL